MRKLGRQATSMEVLGGQVRSVGGIGRGAHRVLGGMGALFPTSRNRSYF